MKRWKEKGRNTVRGYCMLQMLLIWMDFWKVETLKSQNIETLWAEIFNSLWNATMLIVSDTCKIRSSIMQQFNHISKLLLEKKKQWIYFTFP